MVTSTRELAVKQAPKLDEAVEFMENPEPRCACVLLLDTSGSMRGEKIAALNEGLTAFKVELVKDPLACRRVEVAVVTFDSEVRLMRDFATPDQFEPPELTAQGLTHMGTGIEKALNLIEDRKVTYTSNGITYYRPWVFMITDGEPQGEPDDLVNRARNAIVQAEKNKRVAFFAVGVEGANMQQLGTMVVRTPVKLRGLDFVELFVWLSKSAEAVTHSKTDEMVALPPAGWGVV